MPSRLRTAAYVFVLTALLFLAYAPVLNGSWTGDTYQVLDSLESTVGQGPSALFGVHGTDARPLAALSLRLSRLLWSDAGTWSPSSSPAFLLEGLLLLLLAAWGMHGVLRRALLPWLGRDGALSAAHAGASILLLHPLSVSALTTLGARGDLLVLVAGAWSTRIFLASWVSGGAGHRSAVLACAVLAGLSSPTSAFLPWALAGLHFLFTKGRRGARSRARGSLVVLGIVALCVHGEWLLRTLLGADMTSLGLSLQALRHPALWFEKLGVVLLPVQTFQLGQVGFLYAGAGLLLALHPGFVAARWAPRLWGRILVGWILSLLVTLGLGPPLRVIPGSLESAQTLLPAALVMSMGLGIAATALPGWRRSVLPLLLGVLFSILGHGISEARAQRGDEVQALRDQLVEAGRARGWNTRLLVVDPPRTPAGTDALDGALQALLSPVFQPGPPAQGEVDLQVLAVDLGALRLWSRLDEFDDLRRSGAVFLLDQGLFDPEAAGKRVAVELAPAGSARAELTWRGEGRTPAGEFLDPFAARHLRVTALEGVGADETPVVHWTAGLPGSANSEESAPGPGSQGEAPGVWLPGPNGATAVFDLDGRPDWLFAGRVGSAWFHGGLTSIVSAQMSPGPPALEGVVSPGSLPREDPWLFDITGAVLPAVATDQLRWRLEILDLETLTYRGQVLEHPSGGALLFDAVRSAPGTGPLSWSLDLLVQTTCVARLDGRFP